MSDITKVIREIQDDILKAKLFYAGLKEGEAKAEETIKRLTEQLGAANGAITHLTSITKKLLVKVRRQAMEIEAPDECAMKYSPGYDVGKLDKWTD